MTYSKFLNEYIIYTGVNDKFDVTRISPTETDTVTLTAGRYRDMIAVAAEIQTQLNAVDWGTWTATINNTTGILVITCDENFTVAWSYGTTLRDDLGYSGAESTTYA